MKKTIFTIAFFAFFSSLNAQSKEVKNQAIKDSVKHFIRAFSADMQQFAYESDSSKRTKIPGNILQKYFTDKELICPNLSENDDVYREKRPTISINKLLKMLPFAYWQGFQFVIDEESIKVTSVKKRFGKLKEIECFIPVKIWGIKASTRKTNRIGEFLKVTIIPYQNGSSNEKLAIQKVLFTQHWIFDEPLTYAILQNIENEFIEDINMLIKFQKSDEKKQQICQKLQSELSQDTIFFYRSDKVLKTLSINECAKSNNYNDFWNIKSVVQLTSFDLSYVTDIHLSENGQYIGLRSRLEKVSIQSSEKSQWMKNRKNDFIIVPTDIAQSQLSYWQLSNVFIQTLIKQK